MGYPDSQDVIDKLKGKKGIKREIPELQASIEPEEVMDKLEGKKHLNGNVTRVTSVTESSQDSGTLFYFEILRMDM